MFALMADPTARLAAALSDRYTIERELGAGGMATVYLAEDRKHHRKVAIKVLKPELAAVLGADRFIQEIETTAQLQHPHILPLFDSGEGDGFLYYVMPYVQGETLREKLDREKQLGIDEAVQITVEVADALAYAHTQGVVHRDIKPENILLHAGRPMVADFGIALALSAAAGGRMTETGISLGTPHYMSPEQATAEKHVTNRSDIYSLGCVLYEMLAGDAPHTASSAQAIILKILTEQARPVTDARKSVPPNVAAAVHKAMERLPADRFETADAFAEALANPAFRGTAPSLDRTLPSAVTWRERIRDPVVVGTAVVAMIAIGFAIGLPRHAPTVSPIVPPIRFAVSGTDSAPLLNDSPWPATISPDGGTVVYAVGSFTAWKLYARRANELDGHPIPGTDNAFEPFFSSDGQWLAFQTALKTRKVRLDGSAPVTITAAAGGNGADWTADDEIVFGAQDPFHGLSYVSAAGGEPAALTHPDSANGALDHLWPIALPDGKTIVFAISSGTLATFRLAITSLEDGRVAPLGLAGVRPLAVLDGMLVYLRADGAVMAVTLDARKRKTVGTPIPVHDPVPVSMNGNSEIFISSGGAMVTARRATGGRLVWMERDGRTEAVVPGRRKMEAPRLAPDGRRVAAVVTEDGKRDVWIFDPTVSTTSKLTSMGTVAAVEWSADGSRVVFIARGQGNRWAVWSQPATGGARATKLFDDSRQLLTLAVSPDGTSLLLTSMSGTNPDIMQVTLDSVPVVRPYLATTADDYGAEFAPDGRWVAMVSDESGRPQVYVDAFPDPSRRIQISVDGGRKPTWSRDGTRLYYRSGSALLAAQVMLTPTFRVTGRETVRPNTPFSPFASFFVRGYDVTADGLRILGVVPDEEEDDFQLVESPNWITEFRRRVSESRATP